MSRGLTEFQVNLLAGGGAGLIETTVTYPLDLAKTRQQLTLRSASAPVSAVLKAAYREGGVRGLYAGISAPLISEVPRRSLKFTLNGVFKEKLSVVFPEPRGFAATTVLATCAGAAAGASETLIHTPFEVVKIRMQQGGSSSSMVGMITDVVRSEGVLALYTGLEAYALRQIVWNGGFFGLLGLGNAVLPETAAGSKAARNFLLGLAAGSTATVLNNPLDVAKSRIQASNMQTGNGSSTLVSRWSVGVLLDILRCEGVRGICKGLPARLYRSAPGHGLLYMAFESIASLIR
eukprot:gnl/MRDRNA2_/MRDRNA2_45179_c0_seq1.p1 gnl/MRDRNA2_/MRDRNA2_45179_c0~~gnl/MRDRNA2_/MRDRNA2_45179_c0_seq1.p1  ORF type:complete len:291 (-),score=60.38 gnl/MRDRNA2_/MRDRNA2_45179_c0_seq1:239-1111(-)